MRQTPWRVITCADLLAPRTSTSCPKHNSACRGPHVDKRLCRAPARPQALAGGAGCRSPLLARTADGDVMHSSATIDGYVRARPVGQMASADLPTPPAECQSVV